MKILHISDTHGFHRRLRDLPDADVVVHSGDFTMNGSQQEAIDFINWFCDLPYAHKFFRTNCREVGLMDILSDELWTNCKKVGCS